MSKMVGDRFNGYRDSTVPTQTILTSNFIRYNRLNELIRYGFQGSKATHVHLYIDLYGMIKSLFSDSLRTDISDYTAMTSTIVNMCGHYRAFFRSIGVDTTIFLIFSYNCPDINTKFVSSYNKTFRNKINNKMIREMVELNNELLTVLCPYLPDIHFLRTDFESSVLIEFLIRKFESEGQRNTNIIISKDFYPSQITSLHDDTAMLRPKKMNGEDISTIIVPRNHYDYIMTFWDSFCSMNGISIDSRKLYMLHPNNMTLLAAMSRYPERNITSLVSIPRASVQIYNVIAGNPVKISPTSIQDQLQNINLPVTTVEGRYRALDIIFQLMYFEQSVESKMIHFENLSDVGTINNICAKYFTENPIDLQKL